jgi:copper chaperone CopZ
MSTVELQVEAMTCESCIKHVSAALMPLNGVQSVQVDLQTGRVRVTGAADSKALVAALDDAGYPAKVAKAASEGCGGGCCGGCGGA